MGSQRVWQDWATFTFTFLNRHHRVESCFSSPLWQFLCLTSIYRPFTNNSSIPGLGRSPGEWIGYPLQCSWAPLVAQLVKNPPAMWETWVWSLGWEDPLEKGKATHSSILAWRILWTSPWGHKESDTTEQLSLKLSQMIIILSIKIY